MMLKRHNLGEVDPPGSGVSGRFMRGCNYRFRSGPCYSVDLPRTAENRREPPRTVNVSALYRV